MKKFIAVTMVILIALSAAFANAECKLTEGISCEMEDGTTIRSVLLNDEGAHTIYFVEVPDSEACFMYVESNGVRVYHRTIWNVQMSDYVDYITYCVEVGWL